MEGCRGCPAHWSGCARSFKRCRSCIQCCWCPGGGPFADAVRAFEGRISLSPTASHWMAILAMDQYAYVLADRISGGVIVEEPGEIDGVLSEERVPIIAPARWMRSADVFPS